MLENMKKDYWIRNKGITLILVVIMASLITASSCAAALSNTETMPSQTIELVQTLPGPVQESMTADASLHSETTAASTPAALIVETTTALPSMVTTVIPTKEAATVTTLQPVKETTKDTAKITTNETTEAAKNETTTSTTVPVETDDWNPDGYTPNCDNIRNLVIEKLQERGLWYPDAEVIGDDSAAVTTNYYTSDEMFASGYVNGKFGKTTTIGVTSVSCWIENGYLWISSKKCAYPIS